MNRHVNRVARRHRAELIRTWSAALLTAFFMAVFLGRASHAQDMGVVIQSCGTLPAQYGLGGPRPLAVDVNGNLCSTGNSIGPASGNAGYISNATPVTNAGTGSTGAVAATLPAAATQFTYLCGFNISAVGSAAGSVGPIVVAGLKGGSQTYQLAAAATPAAGYLSQTFSPCLPGSAINTAISVTTTADATGTAIDVNAWGFQQ